MEPTSKKWIVTLGSIGGPGLMWVGSEWGVDWPKEILFLAGIIFAGMVFVAVYLWAKQAVKWLAAWQGRTGRSGMLLPIGLVAISTLGVCIGILWFIENYQGTKSEQLTLKRLFETDFPNAVCLPTIEQKLTTPFGETEKIGMRFCKIPRDDLPSKGNAVATFYIPASHHTGVIIRHISENLTAFWPESDRQDVLFGLMPKAHDALHKSAEIRNYWEILLPVWYYCETPPKKAQKLLDELSRGGHMPAEIRSTEYLELEKRRRVKN